MRVHCPFGKSNLNPLLYTCDDITQGAIWQPCAGFLLQVIGGFYIRPNSARLFLKELPQDEELKKKIISTFHQVFTVGLKHNVDLLIETEDVRNFLLTGQLPADS